MARVAKNDPLAIGPVLDRGALGVVVPMVETADEAQAAVESARYGPAGRRSIGGGFMRDWLPFDDSEANDEIFVAIQIETALGVQNAAEIMRVDGVDGCWIGPWDLALSMGVDMESPALREAIRTTIAACKQAGKVPGIATPGPQNEWLEAGCLFVTVGSDVSCVHQGGVQTLDQFRRYRPRS